MTTASSERTKVLAAELAEITRQELRTDNRAGHLTTLSGVLVTLGVATIGGLLAVAHLWLWWTLLPMVLLLFAVFFWGKGMVILLRDILRPNLGRDVRGTFTDPHHIDYIMTIAFDQYQMDRIKGLGSLLYRRYQHIEKAVNCMLAGFVAAGIALFSTAIISFLLVPK